MDLAGTTWTLSHRTGGASIYRAMPPARPPGRGGFQGLAFEHGGKFTLVGPGPDDRLRSISGTWLESLETETFVLRFEAGEMSARLSQDADGMYQLEVVAGP